MKKRGIVGILVLLLAIILVGCAKQQSVIEPFNVKCSQLNGFMCTGDEACNGQLLRVIDSDKCCSIKCEAKADVGAEVPKFDFGKVNDNLGSLQ